MEMGVQGKTLWEKYHMAIKLKSMDKEILQSFLVHFIMSSLSPKFDPFTISHNVVNVKRGIDEAMCVQA